MKIRTQKARSIAQSHAVIILIWCSMQSHQGFAQTILNETGSELPMQGLKSNSPNAESSILGLWINGINLQEEALILKIKNQRYIECSILQKGFVDVSQLSVLKQDNIQYCLIEHADISSEIDEPKQLFKLNIPAQYMLEQKLSAKQRYMPELPKLGGFINYNMYFQDGDYNKEANASTDLNIFWKNILFNSNHIFRKNYLCTRQISQNPYPIRVLPS